MDSPAHTRTHTDKANLPDRPGRQIDTPTEWECDWEAECQTALVWADEAGWVGVGYSGLSAFSGVQ